MSIFGTLRGLIFAKTYFREVKIIVFREDLFSRISHFENFRDFDYSLVFPIGLYSLIIL